ncbi:ABC transporter permease [Catenuloplanes indicus]|uniref:Glycine betaine/proline transport system permease protein n=1 Tax=Catenuloplanes indicus TaxID=137267 RepID=A0AAE4AVQ3_9ACTN|nr:ABC transporter permease subunit [Catenuloplanes indicus]MDQ0365145.1 glycine betaine/proline transport system permease protein [Catenuloplanes indicus]
MIPDVPIGAWVETAIEWLRLHLGGFFDTVAELLRQLLSVVYHVLVLPHPLLLTAVLAGIAWLTLRGWRAPTATVAGLLLVQAMELWRETLQSLSVVLVASVVAVAVGVPIGIWAARSDRVRAVTRPVLDFMQTMPVFVYLLPAVFFFGIGVVPGVVATTIFAVPPAVRLTELGIRQVDREVVEAAVAFGARPRQILRDVQLPLAVPSIMAGINQVIMLALSMVVVAGLVGGGGLGAVVVRAITQLDIGRGFEGGIAVVVLAIYLDRVTAGAGRRLA